MGQNSISSNSSSWVFKYNFSDFRMKFRRYCFKKNMHFDTAVEILLQNEFQAPTSTPLHSSFHFFKKNNVGTKFKRLKIIHSDTQLGISLEIKF